VNPDSADFEIAKLLAMTGRVDPPASATLAAASETLWSAVAAEMLVPGNEPQQPARRQQDRPQQTERGRREGTGP
jgi:hypothetical protein